MTDDPLLGSIVSDRYRIDRLIGEGAMGRVYEAHHLQLQKRVAVKVLHTALTSVPDVVQRFEREARAAAQIEHEHVVSAIDFGKLDSGAFFLILEYVEGDTLAEVIKEGPLPFPRVLDIAIQIASALQVAHERKIVHRDLKPDNLLLLKHEEQDFVKVLDFGVAKVPPELKEASKPNTQLGLVYGTPEYMAPEQALGQQVDARADIYALGVVLYEMLVGRRPYVGPSAGLLGQQLSKELPKMSRLASVRVPPAVEQLVVEMLATDVNKRPQTIGAVLKQLQSLRTAHEEGRLSGGSGRSSSLLSAHFEEVSQKIEDAARKIPRPVKRVVRSHRSRAAIMALTFGAIGVVGAIALLGAWASDDAIEPVEVELTEPPPPVIELPDESSTILPQIEKAKEQGSQGLLALAQQFPTEGLLQAELALAFSKEFKFEEALQASSEALALDPQLNESEQIAQALFQAAQSNHQRSSTFRLLKGAMGPAGVNIIYDLAHEDGVNRISQAYALQQLDKEEVQSAAAPSLRLLLDLQQAKNCEELVPLMKRASLVGDKRSLPTLKSFLETTGCGPQKLDDCYACLRQNNELTEAIETIESRATLE